MIAAMSGSAVGASHVAFADEATEVREAKKRFGEGLDRARAADFEAARLKFLQAYAIIKSPDILWNLALAEEKTKRDVDAIRHFRIYLHDSRIKEDDRVSAQKHIATLATTTGHLEISASMGASITVDVTYAAGTAPLGDPVDVEPGKHHVTARGTDGTYEQDVNVEAGKTVRVAFVASGSAGTPTAPVSSSAQPPTAPATSASATGAAPTSTAGGVVETPPDSGATTGGTFWTTRNVVVIALGVGAVAAAGVGVGFFLGASSQDDKVTSLKAANPNCAGSASSGCGDLAAAADARASDRNVGTAFVIGGGLLGVGAVATFLLWPKSAPRTGGAMVVPMVAPGAAGLRFMGNF